MNRSVPLLALALALALPTVTGCAVESGRADDNVAQSELRSADLAEAVKAEIDERGADGLTEVGRGGLETSSRVLHNAQAAFDEIDAAYSEYGHVGAYRFRTGANAAYIVFVDAGDEGGYAIRVFDANDKRILDGDAPSNSEPIDWTFIGSAERPPVVHSFSCQTDRAIDGAKNKVKFAVKNLANGDALEVFNKSDPEDYEPIKVTPNNSHVASLNENMSYSSNSERLRITGDSDGFYASELVLYKDNGYRKGFVRITGEPSDEAYAKVTCRVSTR